MHSLRELFGRAIGEIWFRKGPRNGWYFYYKFHTADTVIDGVEFLYGTANEDASEFGRFDFITLATFEQMTGWEEVVDKKTLENLIAVEAKKMIEISMP
jgi:hypothetical protein